MKKAIELPDKLDDRLEAAAGFARRGAVAADIGTDHGYLICELVKNRGTPKGYACDINEKPLENAKALVAELGLSEKVECILSDGVDGLPADEIEDVFICGMGGETISGIIERGEWLASERVHLVLQPMSRADALRKWLCGHGFRIDEERAAQDDGHYYTVMSTHYCGEKAEPDELYCAIGELPRCGGETARQYILRQAKIRFDIAEGLLRGGRDMEAAAGMRILADRIKAEAGDSID